MRSFVHMPLGISDRNSAIHHERDLREKQHHTYMWREQAIKEWLWRGSSADINLWTIERND